MAVQPATEQDVSGITALVNSAYRGEQSKKGWTTEADLIEGEARTDEGSVRELMQSKDAVFLKYTGEQNKILGCVFLHKQETRLYLGMLSVSPLIQARGIGKELMKGAIAHAKKMGCKSIYMNVISLRHELISWYEKQGYKKTGATEPFPTDDRFGKPTQSLEFVVLERIL